MKTLMSLWESFVLLFFALLIMWGFEFFDHILEGNEFWAKLSTGSGARHEKIQAR